MITATDFYHVMSALVPLYVAMVLGYGSVKWWKIFSPDQCAGINRFVALFAIPLLSFHFIASNNPYKMNLLFIAGDTLQKIVVLVFLLIGGKVMTKTKRLSSLSCLEWTISLFAIATLPNTLVMGIPLLVGMYGEFTESLMVQIVVLQCIIWYTLMLFLFEYRGARILISEMQLPPEAGIGSIHVDSDVVSLDGRQPLETEVEIKEDGKLHLSVRRSSASADHPRVSNLSNVEIYSLQSFDHNNPMRGSSSSFKRMDDHEFYTMSMMAGGRGSRNSNFGGKEAPRKSSDIHMFAWSSSSNSASINSPITEKKVEEVHTEGNRNGGNTEIKPPASVMTKLILIMVWRKLIRNPNTYSSLIGLIWSLISFRWNIKMPVIIAKSISIMSDAGLGMAMFSLGLFMSMQPRIIACGNSTAAFSMAVRFLAGPAVTAAASAVVGLRGALLHVAIVQAALPQGIVPFVFAKEYNVHPDILSTAVIFGMLIAFPIALVYYILIGL